MLVISGSKNFSTLKSGGMASPEVGPQFKKKKKKHNKTPRAWAQFARA